MLAEFLEKLRSLAEKANDVEIVEHPNLYGKLIVAQNGSHTIIKRDPRPRTPRLHDLQSVLAFIDGKQSELYVDEDGICIVLDASDGWEVASLIFRHSNRYKTLLELANRPRVMTTKEAIHFLRFDLEYNDTRVISAFRNIKFLKKGESGYVVHHGKESLGRSVESAVKSQNKIPESFRVDTEVFLTPGFELATGIEVYIDIDFEAEGVRLIPSRDDLVAAEQDTVRFVIETIQEKTSVPVYYGRFNG